MEIFHFKPPTCKTILQLGEGYMINLCINKQIYKHWMNTNTHKYVHEHFKWKPERDRRCEICVNWAKSPFSSCRSHEKNHSAASFFSLECRFNIK